MLNAQCHYVLDPTKSSSSQEEFHLPIFRCAKSTIYTLRQQSYCLYGKRNLLGHRNKTFTLIQGSRFFYVFYITKVSPNGSSRSHRAQMGSNGFGRAELAGATARERNTRGRCHCFLLCPGRVHSFTLMHWGAIHIRVIHAPLGYCPSQWGYTEGYTHRFVFHQPSGGRTSNITLKLAL